MAAGMPPSTTFSDCKSRPPSRTLASESLSESRRGSDVYPMSQRGFTLIEMSIVLAIVGLLIGGGLVAVGPIIDQTHVTQTRNNMDQVESALLLFVIRNNRLPCPADGSLTNASSLYGMEQVTAATTSSPQVCNVTAATGVPLVNSVIPWITLGLDEQYSIDGWNNRFSYYAAGGQTGQGWDSLVDPGTAGSGASGTTAVTLSGTTYAISQVTFTAQGTGYTGNEPPAALFYGGGSTTSTLTPPAPSAYLSTIFDSTNNDFKASSSFSSSPIGSGYSAPPTIVIGTAGCLYRNGGPLNGRASFCDAFLSQGGTATTDNSYLTPSYPYGNYIAVYSLSGGACSNELTTPNNTSVTTPGTCTASPTEGGSSAYTLQNVQSFGNRAAYVLISHGKSGYCGWTKSGTYTSCTGMTLKTYNSNGSAGTSGNMGFVQGTQVGVQTNPSTTYFDDLVRWRSPAMLIQLCGSGACGNP